MSGRRTAMAAAAVAVTAALLATGLFVPAEQAQAFTVPGQPGTPQAPTPVFTEDFSGQNATGGAISILNYTGSPGTVYSPGVSGASSMTYTADSAWTPAFGQCNGWVFNSTTPRVTTDAGCNASAWSALGPLARYAGQFQGMTTTAAAQNQALTAYTQFAAQAGVQLQTTKAIPGTAGHYYALSAIFAETACQLAQASERFSLIVNGQATVVGENLNPCTDPSRQLYAANTYVSRLQSSALKVTSEGTPDLGLQLYNAQAASNGNDVLFDLPQIFDVTPQLDKAFSPSTIASGQTSTLTFTVTNTSELGAKNGWSFLDDLPDGLTATGTNSTTCSNAAITAPAGAGSVRVANGSLNQGQNSCTITVQVTATTPGTYTNGPGNFPDGTAGLDGLNPPADTTLTVSAPASLNIAKSSTTTAITRVGQVVAYKFTVVNRSAVTVRNLVVTDTQAPPASQAALTPILCETTTLAPQDSTTCTARYTVTQADLDNGSLRDTATASAVDPGGATVTAPPAALTVGTSRPAISIEKTSGTTLVDAVGQQVPYAFTVTNTGNVTLFGVGVTDTQSPPATQANLSAVTCPQPALVPGESQVCRATYTATQADLQNGTLNDSATASGAPEGETAVVSAPSALSIPTQLPGSLTIRKSTTTAAVTAVGQQIPYTFLVTNNSSVTVNGVSVVDTVEPPSLPGNLSTPTCGATSLTAGASTTCTATYQVTQADVNQGIAADSAVARGTDANGNPVQSSPSRVVLHSPISALTVVKSTTSTSVSAVGQQVPYTFVVTNTGNQPLTSVDVADTQVAPASQANMSAVSCPQTALAAGASVTCTGTYTVTAADIANGSVNDFATASGRNPGDTLVTSPQSSATITATPAALTLVKASSTSAFSQIGQIVRYSFTVTNNSSTVYDDIAIQDTQVAPAVPGNLSAISCDTTTLAPGESAVCTASYSVTAADITNGFLNDFATATGTDVGGSTYTTARSSVILPALQNPSIALTKSSTLTRISAEGQQVPYTFTVRNTGNVAVTDVRVADTQAPPATQANMTPVTCPTGALQPGDAAECTGTYTVTRADLDHGFLRDTATASATAPDGTTVDAPEAQLRITSDPALQIEKTSTTTLIDTIGQVVPYEFRVTNIRSTTVGDIRVDDTAHYPSSQAALSAIRCDDVTLAPGASTTCRGTYTVSAADIANGSVTDTAVAEGTDANGLPLPPSEPSTLSIDTRQNPSLTIAKSSNTAVVTRAGQDIAFQFMVRNTGNVVIADLDVTDTLVPPADPANLTAASCPMPTLEPGQSETCTARYVTTAADVANGSVGDSAVATGTTAEGTGVRSAPDDLSIPAPATPPALSIVKSSSSTGISALNEQIPYTFTVTNNSTVPLTDVRVVDSQLAPAVQSNLSAISCPATTLAAGLSMTCTARYTTTQPDFDHGRVDDSAVATGTDPGGTQAESAPSTFSVPVDPVELGLTVQKRSATTLVTEAGQRIPYEFVVTNTGTQTLASISVTDIVSAPSVQSNLSAVVCPPGGLAPDRSVTCTASYTVTEADLNNGSVRDTASASGVSPADVPVHSAPATLSLPTQQAPGIAVTKTSKTSTATRVGELVPYEFVVRNTGNVTLLGVAVTDTVAPPSLPSDLGPVSCPATALAPGAEITCTAEYRVTQADVTNGSLSDTATASGTPPASPADPDPAPVVSAGSTVVVPIPTVASLTMAKSSTATAITSVGQRIGYEFLVTNTGNVPLSGIAVADTVAAPSDPADLGPVTCPTTDLAPNEQTLCTAAYTVTQADLDSGAVSDTASASGTPPATPDDPAPDPVTSPPSSVTVAATVQAGLTVVKSSPQSSVPPTTVGQRIDYRFVVTNTGNVTLSSLRIADTQLAPATPANLSSIDCPTTVLSPGAQTTCTAAYTVTQADIDHGSVSDRATASGSPPATSADPDPAPVESGESRLTVPEATTSALEVVKSSTTASVTRTGQRIPYTFRVTNTGTTTMAGITVADTVAAPSDPAGLTAVTCPGPTLIPGAAMECTAEYTTTQADVDHGSVADQAVASGLDPGGAAVSSPPSALVVDVDQEPAVTLVKSATLSDPASDALRVGETVQYTFVVTNTGNTTLTDLAVDETAFTGAGPAPTVTCPSAPLPPGQQAVCTSSPYTIVAADAVRDRVDNTAEVDVTAPDGSAVVSSPSSFAVPFVPAPALSLVKSADPTTITTAGETVQYTFVVTNTGNVPLDGLAVDELAFSGTGAMPEAACPATELLPGQRVTCTATYQPTQPDVDAGVVVNTAQATGTTEDATHALVASNESSAVVTMEDVAELTLGKTVTPSRVHSAGETVTFRYQLTNGGNTTLTDPAIAETAFTGTGVLQDAVCPATIAPLTSVECTASYTVTQADVDAGTVTNTATARALTPGGTTIEAAPATAVLAASHIDALTLVKSASRSGDTARFGYLVTNVGNTTIREIAIQETAFSGTGAVPSPGCPGTTLAPGESMTCTADYALTAADLAAGTLTNTAAATGTGPDGDSVTSPGSTAGLAMEHAAVSGSALADTGSAPPTGPLLLALAFLLLGLLVLARHRARRA